MCAQAFGLPTNSAEEAKVLVGPQAQGLSASTVSRLKQVWGEEYRQSCEERLDANRWVYVWADGTSTIPHNCGDILHSQRYTLTSNEI